MSTNYTSNIINLINEFTINDKQGQNRLVYSDEWIHNQQLLLKFGHQLGARTAIDFIGNVCLDFIGVNDESTIATGSHMDTVAQGGKFDGLYGILGGLCAIQQLINLYDCPKTSLRLISFSEEEGSRFTSTFTGSKYFANHTQPLNLVDQTGATFDHTRQAAVNKLKKYADFMIPHFSKPKTFTELHIEQGPRLENAKRSVGLVSGIVSQQRFLVIINGITNHAGTTPMTGRQDAVQIGCHLINEIYRMSNAYLPNLILTVGQINVSPNESNVIAGKLQFSIDIRSQSDTILKQFAEKLTQIINLNPRASLTNTLTVTGANFSKVLLKTNIELTKKLKLSYLTLSSGAGHDSQIMNQIVPTAMIFVPSQQGISHHPDEMTSQQDLINGIQLLAASLYKQAYK